ncbi:MAG: D-alanyl-D-alanine carboxypeptidase [Clostridia bacterium]|nr:D-alanyl-D-alanine carboxypeptidase [Clostridia bacterium]
MKKKFIATVLVVAFVVLCSGFCIAPTFCLNDNTYKASVLIEKNSGKVLCEKDAHKKLPIASVTKLMTVLLVLEDIDAGNISLTDKVMVSENANGMGGSQIFLDANEEYVLQDLLKSVIVASANDSSVALAEYIAGSENNFVKNMNTRAYELGMADTHYANATGLPAVDGYSSAYDQAILLSKVLNYDLFKQYSSIWNEDFVHPSGRTTQMTNTNKLSRFYSGCIGGKTGSTNEAKCCLAVGAERDGMQLVAVVLGADTSKLRFSTASELLNYGFANFESKTIFSTKDVENKTIAIKGGERVTHIKPEKEFTLVTEKNKDVNFSLNYNLPSTLISTEAGQVVGNVEVIVDGVAVETINLLATETHTEATLWDYFKEITKA